MKKLSLYSILLFCALSAGFRGNAQKALRLQFIDKITRSPVEDVSILNLYGTETTISDKDGFATVDIPANRFLIAVRKGYTPDTIRPIGSAIVYLTPLTVEMDDVLITNKKVHRVLHSAAEYVVDYDFVDDNILVASYSGNNGKNAKLFLLNDFGDTLALTKFPDKPIALFKSCLGTYYCVCTDKLYPLTIGTGKIILQAPYDVNILPLLKQCEQSIDERLYYHFVDKSAFSSLYSLWNPGDSISLPFYKIEQHWDAMGNAEEMQEILAMLSFGNFREAAKLNGMRGLRNEISYRNLGLPIYRSADSLIIFDFNKKRINYFAPDGSGIARPRIAFDPGKTFRISIVQDLATNKFYLYDPVAQSLEEISTRSGEIIAPGIALKKPLAEKVKVHKGNIYYLWQDRQNSSTRQLFVQAPF